MKKQTQILSFHFLEVAFTLKNRNSLKKFIKDIFQIESKSFQSISFIFCNDAFLLNLNKRFLKHNTYTDIITFTLSLPLEPISSDIYISYDRIKENAQNLNVSFKQELHRVIFHGVLHLCGYNDKTKHDKALMTKKENYYLEHYFVPRETN